jgi:hypothetical protein
MKTSARQSGIGALALRYFYTPLNRARDSIRQGGPWQQRWTEQGRIKMQTAAFNLPLLPAAVGQPLEVHLLTGRQFWYQTAFCLWTFARHAGVSLTPVIFDDGTLTPEFQAPLRRLFPDMRIIGSAEIVARLDEFLPAARYGSLRERWLNYPNIRKLIDPHLASKGWKLVLDSDLLFFRSPDFLVRWLRSPDRPLHAVDCETSYGYSRHLMNELAGAPVADLVNVGLIGLNSGEIDWQKLEHWCGTLIARERTSYYLEQALSAMLVAGSDCAIAPPGDYVTLPVKPEARECQAVMHHYVAHSKRWYFQHNWARALTDSA